MTLPLSLTVNGRLVEATVEPRMHLADFLRDVLHLTGTHLGCEHGVCGACTVVIDGAPMRSCIAYAVACDGADVRTIEGFDDDPLMRALRHAFARHHALQCGYCTPGMLITAHDIVQRLPRADEARVRRELSGNLCRCTGYVGIVQAVRSVLDTPPADANRSTGSTAGAPALRHDTDEPSTAPTSGLHPPQPGPGPVDQARNLSMRLPGASSRVDSSSPAPISTGAEGVQGATNADWTRASTGDDPSVGMATRQVSERPNSFGSRHEITLAVAPDPLWHVLKDIPTVVRCLPGASLAGPPDADPLLLDMEVAIGPMRARFEGSAHITFDEQRRTAAIDGSGHDTRSRSTGEGRIELSVQPATAGGSILHVRLHYALKGPLAQFSRGAIVDVVVDQILERFATNLSSTAGGGQTDSAPPVGGLGLAAAAFRRWLRWWLTRTDR